MTYPCLISFGSNLGDRDSLMAQAARDLAESPLVQELKTSRLFETPPIGGPGGQDTFINAAAAFETRASARQILQLLQDVEQRLGRERLRRWDARSIDLDVVLHGDLVGEGNGLLIPHPRYTARQFVLQPACDVAADYCDPRFGWTIKKLASHLQQGVPSIALQGGSQSLRTEICQRLWCQHQLTTFPERSPKSASLLEDPATPNAANFNSEQTPKTKAKTEIAFASSSLVGDQSIRTGALGKSRWISGFLPPLPSAESREAKANYTPRLIARIHQEQSNSSWPTPERIWPSGRSWPEYHLEIDDLDWAVSELISALDSMRCPVQPITPDGSWW